MRQPGPTEIEPTRAIQSFTYGNDEDQYAAVHAIDMDLSTVAVADMGFLHETVWLELELERIYFIHTVVIYHRFYTNWFDPHNWCAQNEDQFKGCLHKSDNVDVSVYLGEEKQKSCGTLQLTNGLKQSDQIYKMICNTVGDTVRLSKTTGSIYVCEISITSTGKDEPDVTIIFRQVL